MNNVSNNNKFYFQAGEAKAQHGLLERELRLKILAMEKSHNDIVEDLQVRMLSGKISVTPSTKRVSLNIILELLELCDSYV